MTKETAAQSLNRPSLQLSREEANRLDGFSLSFKTVEIWEKLLRNGHASRADLDPLSFGANLLPHLVILNVIGAGEDYQWRLFGGAHISEYGVNLTGLTINQLMEENSDVEEVKQIFVTCYETQEPVFYRIQYANRRGTIRAANGVILPLFEEVGRKPIHLLGCTEWQDDKDALDDLA